MGKSNEMKALEAKFKAADEKLEQAHKDLAFLQLVNKRYKRIKKNIDSLNDYYFTDWLDDRKAFQKKNKKSKYKSLGEDSIYDVSQDLYYEQVALLKKIVNDLHG